MRAIEPTSGEVRVSFNGALPGHLVNLAVVAHACDRIAVMYLGGPRITLTGEIGDLANLPPGCAFHPRCRYARDICRAQKPPLVETSPPGAEEHLAACHLTRELQLQGCR